MYGKTKDVFECFSLLLECCSCLLGALDQNKVKAFLFLKDSLKIPHALLFNFQNKLLAEGVTA